MNREIGNPQVISLIEIINILITNHPILVMTQMR